MPYVKTDDIDICYDVHGEGEPLVLLHGFMSSRLAWTRYGYVAELKKSHKVIVLDQRGHGQSGKPHVSSAYAILPRLGDIKAVMADLGINRASFLGYSMGGWVAFGMAAHYPEMVDALIVGGGHPYFDKFDPFFGIDGSDPDACISALERKMSEKFDQKTRSMMLENDFKALAAAATDRQGFESLMDRIPRRVFLYAGDQDERYPLMQRAARELNGQLVVLPGASHVTALSDSNKILPEIKRFLHVS
ncbi:MAG TPA: alpha/beta hydrolase [Burkholderiaceae bacterium]|jgi:pimeloyl-ACP methyl ester carboxylesterase